MAAKKTGRLMPQQRPSYRENERRRAAEAAAIEAQKAREAQQHEHETAAEHAHVHDDTQTHVHEHGPAMETHEPQTQTQTHTHVHLQSSSYSHLPHNEDTAKHEESHANDAALAEMKKKVEEYEARIAELESQAAETADLKEEAARTRADFYNYRTRVERDKEKDRILAAEKACDSLLPVLDNLDRTISAIDDKASAVYKGVVMVQKQFLAALQSLGLSLVDTSGDFDPKQHEAMMTVDVTDESQDGKIIEVLNRGYRLGDKLLRAALVKVGRKK